MYQVIYDGKLLKPILAAKDAIYWANRIGKIIPRRDTQIVRADTTKKSMVKVVNK